jgi:hypothetical protein
MGDFGNALVICPIPVAPEFLARPECRGCGTEGYEVNDPGCGIVYGGDYGGMVVFCQNNPAD